jgi:hypothetical protein
LPPKSPSMYVGQSVVRLIHFGCLRHTKEKSLDLGDKEHNRPKNGGK